ncbi:DUF523 domain-containing protein [Enterovibrio paralichthyis]|uniref:DUF523 domain-containing protein n=1 Tax=Enterovibrio paralichthyis TaxID=2853805 RepID=UPI001C457EE6|nr:DUF523 domain-containing protein [Enterovibrio paralichthyis]MBV7296339.1 DUF523 domain-containing protein [Enterovibrio paralichthyis]
MIKVLVSACLMGEKVRYDGNDLRQTHKAFTTLEGKAQLVPFCPEVAGGLSTPRPPAEIDLANGESVWSGAGKVIATTGSDVTDAFCEGAKKALAICQQQGIRFALMTESSPSCGSSLIYNGKFSGQKVSGEGVTTALLRKNGIAVFSQNEVDALLNALKDCQ